MSLFSVYITRGYGSSPSQDGYRGSVKLNADNQYVSDYQAYVTPYIELVNGAEYIVEGTFNNYGGSHNFLYDENKEVVKSISNSEIKDGFTVESNVKFIRMSYNKYDKFTFKQLTEGNVEPEPEPFNGYTINETLINKLSSVNGTIFIDGIEQGLGFKVPNGSKFEVKLNGYEFADKGGSPMGGGYKVGFGTGSPMGGGNWWFKGSDLSHAVNNNFNGDSNTTFVIEANQIIPEPEPEPEPTPEPFNGYTVTEQLVTLLAENHLTMLVNGEPISLGYQIQNGSNIIVNADSGYQFLMTSNGKPVFGTRSPLGGSTYWNLGNSESQAINNNFNGYPNLVFVTNVIESPIDESKGLNNLFLITESEANKFIRSEYKTFNGNDTVNHKKHVIGMVKLPFTIDESFIVEKDRVIRLAGYDTNETGDLLKSDVYVLDMGTITVPDDKNNSLSRINSVCILHLPYSESVTLDIDYVIGNEISIEYVVNLYDSLCTVNIYSSKLDGVILTLGIDLNSNMAFGYGDYIPSNNDPHNVAMGLLNGVSKPYIELLRNNAILENGFFTIPVIDESLISDCDGFVRVENVNLNTTATTQEKELIINELNKGIIL